MDRDSPYYQQAQLVVRVLPYLEPETCFALKGGTAINLFLHNMPRLSVDIDLTYLPLAPRGEFLLQARESLRRVASTLAGGSPFYDTDLRTDRADQLQLFVAKDDRRIKIECNPVIRGTVYPPARRDVHPAVESEFGFASAQVLSDADLYGGKICAALDRQHPRDLFDVMLLLEEEKLSAKIFRAFLVYLISHNRPMHEILDPRLQDLEPAFTNEFRGMTVQPVSLQQLLDTRKRLMTALHDGFTDADKRFLISVKKGTPEWDLLRLPDIERLPAVQWKLENLAKMSKRRHGEQLRKLEAVLGRF